MERSMGFRKRSTAYDGESFALAAGMSMVKHLADEDSRLQTIKFVLDNTSVFANILKTHPHPSQQLSILFTTGAQEFLESDPTSLSFHKEKASQLVLQGWHKDYEKRVWHSTF